MQWFVHFMGGLNAAYFAANFLGITKKIRILLIRAVDRLAAGLGRGECSTRQKNHQHSSESTHISAPPFRQPNTPVHGVMSFASWYITGSTTTGTTMPYHQGIFRL